MKSSKPAKTRYICSDGVEFESLERYRSRFAVVQGIQLNDGSLGSVRKYFNNNLELEEFLANQLRLGYIVDTGLVRRLSELL